MKQGAGSTPALAEPRTRRRRRTREDVAERIRQAARQLFAERGYNAATTKEIARLADVSETLLFRYYGDKAKLFDEVVTEPFQRLMDEFITRNPDPIADTGQEADTRRFTRQVFELFETNEGMFRALLTGPAAGSKSDRPGLGGLAHFFDQGVEQVQRRYEAAGLSPPFDLQIGVRLGFAMIASSVLMRDSLFPGWTPDRDALIQALEQLVAQSLTGPAD
jgi:AcrR family transcriptional regulator